MNEEQLRSVEHQRRFVDYVFVSATALLVYDYLLLIPDEIALVWMSKWNYTKVLFLVTRYIPAPAIFFLLHDQLFLNNSANACAWSYVATSWLSLVAVLPAQAILMIRTWVLWNLNRRVALLLVSLWCAITIAGGYWIGSFSKDVTVAPAPYPGYRGCVMVQGSKNYAYLSFYSMFVIDSVVLFLVSLSAFKAYRSGDTPKLLGIIHRDGIIFYVCLLLVTFACACTVRYAPIPYRRILVSLPVALYPTFATRVILNIKRTARKGLHNSDLHTLDMAYSTHLEFVHSVFDRRDEA